MFNEAAFRTFDGTIGRQRGRKAIGSFFDRFLLFGGERGKSVLTVDVQMEPGAVLVGRPVEEDDLALVPSLIALADVG